MTLKKQALSGTLWTGIQQFSTQGISFFVSIILARLLMPAEIGLIGMIGLFMGIGNVLITSGMNQSLIRTTDADEEDFSGVFYFNVIMSVVVYFIFFSAAPFIANFYNEPLLSNIIKVYCLSFIITAFSSIQSTRLTQKLDFKTQMIVAVPSLIIGSVVGIVMAYQGFGVWSLVVSSLVQSFFATIQLWFYSKWKPIWVFNRTKIKKHWNFGYKLLLSGMLDTIYINAYTLIIGKFFSPSQVGFYQRADTLKQFPVSNIGNILNKVTFPLFAAIQDDDVKLKDVYRRIMQLVIYLVAPVLIFMAVLAEPLFRFLLTEKWLPAVPYFQILCANGILYPLHAYNLNILQVKGRSDLFFKLEVIKKIIITVTIIISFQWGIYGLLYGSVIFSCLAFFINTHYSGKFLNYTAWKQAKDILPTIFLAGFVGFLMYCLDYYVTKPIFIDVMRLLIGGTAGVVLYVLLSYLLKMEALKELRNIILRR